MVAAASSSSGSWSSRHHASTLLGVCAGAAAIALASGLTAFLHNLLSDSSRHSLPEGLKCDFGVVLGYALHRNGSCTRPLQSRVEVGVAAFLQGDAARLIFSGAHPGTAPADVSEANAMVEYAGSLVEQQPPPGSWLLEESSTSTRTNAWYSLDIVNAQQQQQQQQRQQSADSEDSSSSQQQLQQEAAANATLLIITSPFHQLRSYYTFRRAAQQKGLTVQLYSAKAPFAGHCGYGHWLLDAVMDQVDFWRELAALGWYGVRGWL